MPYGSTKTPVYLFPVYLSSGQLRGQRSRGQQWMLTRATAATGRWNTLRHSSNTKWNQLKTLLKCSGCHATTSGKTLWARSNRLKKWLKEKVVTMISWSVSWSWFFIPLPTAYFHSPAFWRLVHLILVNLYFIFLIYKWQRATSATNMSYSTMTNEWPKTLHLKDVTL